MLDKTKLNFDLTSKFIWFDIFLDPWSSLADVSHLCL
jgi:hypothetical protein